MSARNKITDNLDDDQLNKADDDTTSDATDTPEGDAEADATWGSDDLTFDTDDDEYDIWDDEDTEADTVDDEDDDIEWGDPADATDTDDEDTDPTADANEQADAPTEDDEDDEDDEDTDTEDEDRLAFLDGDDDEYEVTDLDDPDAEAGADDNTDEDVDKDAIIAKLRKENAARRQKLRDAREQSVGAVEDGVNEFVNQFAGTLGIKSKNSLDATSVTEVVAERMAALATEAANARRDLAIFRAAVPAGADMDKLADSKAFTSKINKLDAGSETYEADIAKAVASALERNPHFKSSPKITRSGGDFTGGTTANNPAEMSVEEMRKRRRARRGV